MTDDKEAVLPLSEDTPSPKRRLVVHVPLIRLARDPEDEILGDDPDERGNEFYFWHPSQSPMVYRDTTPIEFGMRLYHKEESFEHNRVYGFTKSYPLGARHESEIHEVSFKVELKTEHSHSFFYHFISYARDDSWLKDEDVLKKMVTFL